MNVSLKLLHVPTWDFGQFCIGDDEYHCYPIDFRKKYAWLPRYAGVTSKQELGERIQQWKSTDTPQPGSGLPFLPTFTLNVYNPELVEPATGVEAFPKAGIDVAVRFVHHLDLGEVEIEAISTHGFKHIDFPMDQEVTLEPEDDVTSLTKALTKLLEDTKESEGVDVTSGVLFEEPLLNKWEFKLWVMPQSPELRKLFRYPTAWEGSTGLLHEFLDPKMVAGGDRRLYMEAHVVPKRSRQREKKRPDRSEKRHA